MNISIIVPVLNEAHGITPFLAALQAFRRQGHEVIVVDGGSTDDTGELASPLVDQILASRAGRARQMNLGAAAAQGDVLLFLHADTVLPQHACDILLSHLKEDVQWGRFDVQLSGSAVSFRVIEYMMNLRSRWTKIATGDQALFVKADLFRRINGFAEIPLMEDVELSARLNKLAACACLRARVKTSSRRWETQGIVSTVLLMWRLRFSFWRGVAPEKLVRQYYA